VLFVLPEVVNSESSSANHRCPKSIDYWLCFGFRYHVLIMWVFDLNPRYPRAYALTAIVRFSRVLADHCSENPHQAIPLIPLAPPVGYSGASAEQKAPNRTKISLLANSYSSLGMGYTLAYVIGGNPKQRFSSWRFLCPCNCRGTWGQPLSRFS
jgi:hypothetical protein